MSSVSNKPISSEPLSAYITDNPSDPINITLGNPLKVWGVRIPYSGYGGQGLQVFTPTRIRSYAAGQVLDVEADDMVSAVVAIRVKDAVDYKINGQGQTATLPAGSVTGIAPNIRFYEFPNGGVVEIM